MRVLSTIVLLGVLAGLFPEASSAVSPSGCLCTSDLPCWPAPAVFARLASQLSQPLVYPRPSASACYPPSDPSGNCTDVVANWYNTHWRASHPGSAEYVNWEEYLSPNGTLEACFLNTSITGTCAQGRVPVVGVDARSVGDVQAALGFAVEYGLKLVVKNTGHDFIGRSTAQNSLVVWTHNMKNISYDSAFVPQGAPENEAFEAITLGAGVQWDEAYAAANEHGRLMVGGAAPTIGAAGGWLAGGGHSALSPSYGLGVDNALEIFIVLSTGEHLATNAYQNSDLFWALRGGGGGTYGIVTSVTYRTYPMVPVQKWRYQANVTNSSALPQLVEGLLRFQDQLMGDGWGGYGLIAGQGLTFSYYGPNMTNETAATTTAGWNDFVQSLTPYGVVSASTISYFPSWYEPLQEILGSEDENTAEYVILTSRLLTRDAIAYNASEIAQLLVSCQAEINAVAGGKVSQFSADAAGVNPVWRDAVAHTVCGFIWNETTTSMGIQQVYEQGKELVQEMYEVTPNAGAYFNEASPFEVNWQATFFGAHYPTLKSIQEKYDSYRMFVVWEGVGSEDWTNDLTCRN